MYPYFHMTTINFIKFYIFTYTTINICIYFPLGIDNKNMKIKCF